MYDNKFIFVSGYFMLLIISKINIVDVIFHKYGLKLTLYMYCIFKIFFLGLGVCHADDIFILFKVFVNKSTNMYNK